MISQDRAQGQRIDEFLESTLTRFNYVECTDCNTFREASSINSSEWKFSAMGLRPSILSVAKGLCPTCQEMRKQFRGIIEK